LINQIIFYWQGKDTSIPLILIKSIRIIFRKIKIIQISDPLTPQLNDVDEIIIIKTEGKLMTDRLKGYAKVKTLNRNSLFIDADTIILNNFDMSVFKKGIYLYQRTTNPMINHLYPQYYPEFEGKYFNDLMPFLAGVILIANYRNFFEDLFNLIIKEPIRLQKWYGDQIVLFKYYKINNKDFYIFNLDFLYVLEFDGKNTNINLNLKKENKLLTFKGSSKKLIKPIFDLLTKKIK